MFGGSSCCKPSVPAWQVQGWQGLTNLADGRAWGKLSDCLLSSAALKRRLRLMCSKWLPNCIGITEEGKHFARHGDTTLYLSFFRAKPVRRRCMSSSPKANFIEWTPMTLPNACASSTNLKPETQGFLHVMGFHSILITFHVL